MHNGCVFCGTILPEGNQVCLACATKYGKEQVEFDFKEGTFMTHKLVNDSEICNDGFKKSIDHPDYYDGKHECIETMRVMFGDEAVKGFCRCNAYKYRFRAGHKDGESVEKDIAKAEWYEEYLMRMEGVFD